MFDEIYAVVQPQLENIAKVISSYFNVPYDEYQNDDGYGYEIVINDIFVGIKLIDGKFFEGAEGVNILIDIVRSGGELLGQYCPYNFTEKVWTSDIEELKQRISEAPIDEAINLVKNNLGY